MNQDYSKQRSAKFIQNLKDFLKYVFDSLKNPKDTECVIISYKNKKEDDIPLKPSSGLVVHNECGLCHQNRYQDNKCRRL